MINLTTFSSNYFYTVDEGDDSDCQRVELAQEYKDH